MLTEQRLSVPIVESFNYYITASPKLNTRRREITLVTRINDLMKFVFNPGGEFSGMVIKEGY